MNGEPGRLWRNRRWSAGVAGGAVIAAGGGMWAARELVQASAYNGLVEGAVFVVAAFVAAAFVAAAFVAVLAYTLVVEELPWIGWPLLILTALSLVLFFEQLGVTKATAYQRSGVVLTARVRSSTAHTDSNGNPSYLVHFVLPSGLPDRVATMSSKPSIRRSYVITVDRRAVSPCGSAACGATLPGPRPT